MPYRRLPNTDASRIRALKRIFENQDGNAQIHVISIDDFYKIKNFLPKFESKIKHQRSVKNAINARSKKHNKLMRNCRLYLSHFIQVVNFSIIRGEISPDVREYYDIGKKEKTVPQLNLDYQILEWGKKIIEGEEKRISEGGAPVYNPSIALVKIQYEQFKESNFHYKTAQDKLKHLNKDLISFRKKADKIITSVWNKVERFYDSLPDIQRREKCEDFGIVYVFRKGEKERLIEQQKANEMTLSFDFDR